VARGVPLKLAVEEVTNPPPLIVSVSGPLPAEAEEGDRLVIEGWGLLAPCTVKLAAAEVPPPGEGFETVTGKAPALAKSLAGTVAVTSLELTNAVERAVPLKLTVDPPTKLDPITVIVTLGLPAGAALGVKACSEGKPVLAWSKVWLTSNRFAKEMSGRLSKPSTSRSGLSSRPVGPLRPPLSVHQGFWRTLASNCKYACGLKYGPATS
jgi:hypothetical protein